jgi:hypothetical protein
MITKEQIAAWVLDRNGTEYLEYDIKLIHQCFQDLAPVSEWVSLGSKYPVYGEAVFIKIGGTVQNIAYNLEGADNTADWLEPYYFEASGELCIHLKNGAGDNIEWIYPEELARLPTPPEAT